MRVPAADREVTTSDNYPSGAAINETEVANVVRVCMAEYNTAAMHRRDANATMRDEKRAFQKKNAEAYEAIQSVLESAREKLKEKLRAQESYAKAEDDKRDAALRMKAAVKKLKAAGIDPAAFKVMLKMADMDEVERTEWFDMVDILCKAARLW